MSRINEVSVKRGSTVTRIINNHGGGVQTVSLNKSTLSPDEDLSKQRSVVTILGQTITEPFKHINHDEKYPS